MSTHKYVNYLYLKQMIFINEKITIAPNHSSWQYQPVLKYTLKSLQVTNNFLKLIFFLELLSLPSGVFLSVCPSGQTKLYLHW